MPQYAPNVKGMGEGSQCENKNDRDSEKTSVLQDFAEHDGQEG